MLVIGDYIIWKQPHNGSVYLFVAYLTVQEVLPQCEEELLELLKVKSKVGNGLILCNLPLAREHLGVTERPPEADI